MPASNKTVDQIISILLEEIGLEKTVLVLDRIRKEVAGSSSATTTFHMLYQAAARKRVYANI